MSDLDGISVARLRLAFPDWPVICPVLGGWSAAQPAAHGGLRALYAPSLESLTAALAETDREQADRRRAADRLAERCMDVLDRAVAEGRLPG